MRSPQALKGLLDALGVKHPKMRRAVATMALAKLADVANRKTETVDLLGKLLRDSGFRVRMTVPDAAKVERPKAKKNE